MKQKRILVTSAGGPAAENVIGNLVMANDSTYIVGCDCDEYMIQLSSAYKKYIVPFAHDTLKYVSALNEIVIKEKITMIYPQSDLEVKVCSRWRNALLAPVCLPEDRVIEICQNKARLYKYLRVNGIRVPMFKVPTSQDICGKGPDWHSPYWIRATTGAGGNKAFLANSWKEFQLMAQYYQEKGENIEWMVIKYLGGDDYAWTSIWKDGELLTSVLKKRIKWVYNRIGTTAVQETVYDQEVNKYCESIVKALDPKLTGIMMIDMKQDLDDGKFYITEINSGRLGTVNLFFGWASREIYHDRRVNFPWLLAQICHGGKLPELKKFDALPEHLFWIRHIDMGAKLLNSRDDINEVKVTQ